MPFVLLFGTLAASCYGSIKLTNWIFSDKAAKPGTLQDKVQRTLGIKNR